MRILHTSDWHLGVEYFQRSRRAEHQAFLDWLLETIEARDVDVLVVAGGWRWRPRLRTTTQNPQTP